MRPSKGMSLLMVIVGLFFFIHGMIEVIWYGFFGVIWTLVAFGITIMHAANLLSKDGVAFSYVEIKRKKSRRLK
jgi:hypothetical protein